MGRPVHFSPELRCGQRSDVGCSFDSGFMLSLISAPGSDTDLIVTNRITVVYPITEEVVKQAFIEEGKADRFKPENVRFISEDQFA